MSEYRAPLRDMQFVLKELAGLDNIAKLPGCEEVTAELVGQILEESAKFASGVLSPLNKPADEEGSKWENGAVRDCRKPSRRRSSRCGSRRTCRFPFARCSPPERSKRCCCAAPSRSRTRT